jgi:aspartate-semialdehyde dehydrogenase
LSSETIALLSQSELPEPDTFPGPIAFDCMPTAGSFEATLEREVARVLGSGVEVAATSVQVPTFVGEGSVLAVQTARAVSPDEARGLLEKAIGVELWATGRTPTTRDTAGRDRVLVGPVRRDPSHERSLLLWIAADGLQLVASEVVRIAETRLRLN